MDAEFPLIENTIHGWIVGYYCDCILHEWSGSFEPWSASHIKLATYLDTLSEVSFFRNELQYKLELICWLPKLYKLEKQENEESFFEIIRNMDATKKIYPESLKEETTEFFTQLKKQCILLCWQNVGFIAAKNLYQKLASENHLDKTSYASILEVLETNDTKSETIKHNIDVHISNLISTYVKMYLSTIPTSFLIRAASRAVEAKKKDDADMFDNQKEIRLPPNLMTIVTSKLLNGDTLESNLHLTDDDNKHYKEKLQNIWEKSKAEYFIKVQNFEENIFSHPVESSKHLLSKNKHRKISDKSDEERQQQNVNPSDDVPPPSPPQVAKTPAKPDTKTRIKPKTIKNLVSPVNDRYPELKHFHVRGSLKCNPLPQNRTYRKSYRNMWSEKQEEEFYLAVEHIGIGKWANIRDYLNCERSNVNLKDKWRNLIQTGRIKHLTAKFGHDSL